METADHAVRVGGVSLFLLGMGLMTDGLKLAAGPGLARHKLVVARLNQSIADFVSHLHGTGMSGESARRLPEILRMARYQETARELAAEASAAMGAIAEGEPGPEHAGFADGALAPLTPSDPGGSAEGAAIAAAAENLEGAYQVLKASLLAAPMAAKQGAVSA